MKDQSVHGSNRRTSPAGWAAIVASGAILGVFIWYAFWGYNLTEATIAEIGLAPLVLGVALSVVLGGGLMALLFWSNRKGYDR